MASDTNQYLVVEVLGELNKVVQDAREALVEKENFWRFVSYLEQLQPILAQWGNVKTHNLPLRVQTAVHGIKSELLNIQEPLQLCRKKSRLYLLIHCETLVKEIQKATYGIGHWLALVPSSNNSQFQDLGKKADELAREMQQACFRVSENEERICMALKRENQSTKVESSDTAVQNAILMDIGRELGLDLERNRGALFEQLQLLRRELVDCPDQTQLQLLRTIECLFQSCASEPAVANWHHIIVDSSDDDPIAPFESFVCPLTKQVMKDPVFLQSNITYERSAIELWFKACRVQQRVPSCPVTAQILTSTELRPSLVLRQTISEWVQRNIAIRVRQAATHLGPAASVEENEHALDDIIRLAEENLANRLKLKEGGLIPHVLGLWQRHSKLGTHLRSRALTALRSMAIDSLENKNEMVDLGVLKPTLQSLSSNVDKERESAASLLYELSLHPRICERVGSEKGAILILVGVTSNNSGNVGIRGLAEQTLTNLEQFDSTIMQMAEAGRLKPLLTRLCEGSGEIQVTLAKHLGHMILTNTSKEVVAQTGGQTLVRMLSLSPDAREAALGALLNLSSLEDSGHVLIKAGILAHLLFVMFSLPAPTNLKETAACTLANLVSVPGNWEGAKVDKEGNTLQSEKVLHKLLGLLLLWDAPWKDRVLQSLYGMAASPLAADMVAAHISSGNGINTLMVFMANSDANLRINALRLLSVLSVRIGKDIAFALRITLQLKHLKELLLTSGKGTLEVRIAAATILANIPLTEFEAKVIRVLEVDMLPWTVNALLDCKAGKLGKISGRAGCALQEALVGVLLHFARTSNLAILNSMRELHLFTVFQDQLLTHGPPSIKERAAIGLQVLSEKANLFTVKGPLQVSSQRCFFGSCFFPKNIRDLPERCYVHGGICDANETFCLVAANGVVPLVELLEEEEDFGVREAAISALSTLLLDGVNLKGGVEELVKAEGVQPIFDLFYTVRQGRLQERTIWMIERILRMEEYGGSQGQAVDQGLVKALVEAFKHGTPATRALAREALTHLRHLSVAHSGSKLRRNSL